jgi:non-ribosomal peptide synthetase component F
MIPPDYPRLPHSYKLDSTQIRSVSQSIDASRTSSSSTSTLRAAAALTLAAHAGEDRYAFEVEGGQVVEGEVDRDGKGRASELLKHVSRARGKDKEDVMRLRVMEEHGGDGEQRTPLQLVLEEAKSEISLNYDSSLLTELEAQWFLSHAVTAYTSLLESDESATLSSIQLAPPTESSSLAKLSQAPPPPASYPSDCTTLPSFFLNAAKLYPNDPALHFSPSPESPKSEDLLLSFSQLLHLSRYLAQSLLSSVSEEVSASTSDYIVPLCIDKSPQMLISMVAITLAGFGYLALEPSWPAGRKETILNELTKEGRLAGVAIVQDNEGENDTWSSWKFKGTNQPLLNKVINPSSVLRNLKSADLDNLEEEYPSEKREWPNPREDGIAYVIYTSGTTGAPKGIQVQHRNVAAFLR